MIKTSQIPVSNIPKKFQTLIKVYMGDEEALQCYLTTYTWSQPGVPKFLETHHAQHFIILTKANIITIVLDEPFSGGESIKSFQIPDIADINLVAKEGFDGPVMNVIIKTKVNTWAVCVFSSQEIAINFIGILKKLQN